MRTNPGQIWTDLRGQTPDKLGQSRPRRFLSVKHCTRFKIDNLREAADHHPGVRREREARKRGPRHRFWPSAGAAAAAGAAAPAGAVADCDSAWEGSQKLKIGAPKRPFRVGGVAKVRDPTPQNSHSAWEGSQKWVIRRRKTAIPVGGATKSIY